MRRVVQLEGRRVRDAVIGGIVQLEGWIESVMLVVVESGLKGLKVIFLLSLTSITITKMIHFGRILLYAVEELYRLVEPG